jgi:hypothetical protein
MVMKMVSSSTDTSITRNNNFGRYIMKNQKEAVFAAVCAVFETESFDGAVKLEGEDRKSVIAIVSAGLMDGSVEMKDTEANRAKKTDEKEMTKYTNGLVSNWLRKDKRLNGGVKHQIQNPGSRAGSGDKVLKELRKLKATLSSPEQIEAVDVEITKRTEAIAAEKAKTVTIDIANIPEELRHLIPTATTETVDEGDDEVTTDTVDGDDD